MIPRKTVFFMKGETHMKKSFRKLVTLSLAAMLAASALAGCGGDGGSSAASDSGSSSAAGTDSSASGETEAAFQRNEKGYPDLEGATISIWYAMHPDLAKYCSDLHQFTVIQQLEEDFNCTLEIQYPPVGQEQDNFSIMLAGGEWPDIIFSSGVSGYYPGGVGMAITDGVALDPTPYINETNTPNFLNIMEEYDAEKLFVDDNGRMINFGSKICNNEETKLEYVGPLIRKDYLEATGLDVPVTVDDWYEMLTAMKANGVQYPLALNGSGWQVDRACDFIGSAYGVSIEGYFVKEDGTVGYGMAEPGFKEYITTMNKWYSEGLINPDFMNQNIDDVQSLMGSGSSGAAVMHLADYNTKYFQTTEVSNPDAALVPAQYPVLNEGDPLTRFNTAAVSLADGKTITTTAEDPMACIYFLDGLYIKDIDLMMGFGVEGVAYNMENGVPMNVPQAADATDEEKFQYSPGQFHATESMYMDQILNQYSYGCDAEAFDLWKQGTEDGVLPSAITYTDEENETISKYQTDLDTYVQEMFLKFMTGTEPLDNFDAFVAHLDELHLQDLLAVKQAAYDRYLAR